MVNMLDGRDLGLPSSNFKYEKLSKEHDLLKEKLDKTLKELAQEREGKKPKSTTASDDSKSNDEVKESKQTNLNFTINIILRLLKMNELLLKIFENKQNR